MKKKGTNNRKIRIREAYLMRKRRKSLFKQKTIRINRNKRKSTSNRRNHRQGVISPVEVIAPQYFTIQNIERILVFLSDTERMCNRLDTKTLKVNLDGVKEIDSYAICLMLSMLSRLSYKNIHYWGTYPVLQEAKNYILESGFLDVMKSTIIKRPSNKRMENRMFMIGKDCVDSHRIGKAVRESMAYITGKEIAYPPVYDNMLEISANSVEHANLKTQDKNWLVSISFEDDKVHYILTDTGFGILATLKKKVSQKVNDFFSSKTDSQILYDVFNSKYQSITGEINRHKGLPIILESFLEGFVSNLIVVTNKVLYDFENDETKVLKHGYNGVLYSWTVSRSNYDIWEKSL